MTKGKPETVPIAITCADGSLAIMQFVTKQQRGNEAGGFIDPGWTREPTKENIEAEIAKANIPMVSWRFCTLDEIPADRTFRNAWKDGGKKIDVEMVKARALTRDRLRTDRAPILAEMDVAFMKALETDDRAMLATVASEKQRLRDITADPRIEAAATADDLKAIRIDV